MVAQRPPMLAAALLSGLPNPVEENGEHSLICLVYNINRAINILGMPELLKKLNNWKPNYKAIHLHIAKRLQLEPFYAHQNSCWKIAA